MIGVIQQLHDRMKACVRPDDGVCLDWLEVKQGLRQRCVLSPLLSNVFLTFMLTVVPQRFGEDAVTLAELAYLKEPPTSMGLESAMDYICRAVWGMPYVDGACIVSRSPKGLAKMMKVNVEICRASAITVSAKTIKIMCMPPPRKPCTRVRVEATGKIFKYVQSFAYQRGHRDRIPDMFVEIARRICACWMRIRQYLRELYDQPNEAVSLKTRMMKAEAIEVLLYECSTYVDPSPGILRQTPHRTPPGLASHHQGTAQETRPSDNLAQPCP